MKKNEKVVVDEIFDYVFEHLCSNDYHAENDLIEKIIYGTSPSAMWGNVLFQLLKDSIRLLEDMSKDEDDDSKDWFKKEIEKGNKLIMKLVKICPM